MQTRKAYSTNPLGSSGVMTAIEQAGLPRKAVPLALGFSTPLVIILAGIGIPLIAEVICVLIGSGGNFTYPLDAAYVHLSLAQQITHGTYGLSPGESSAPVPPFSTRSFSPR